MTAAPLSTVCRRSVRRVPTVAGLIRLILMIVVRIVVRRVRRVVIVPLWGLVVARAGVRGLVTLMRWVRVIGPLWRSDDGGGRCRW